jgi:cell division topological specificity factor
MIGWVEKFLGKKTTSADQAKDRLRLVLINDRTDLTSDELESMKNELLAVIAKYLNIDSPSAQISMTQEGREQRLVADIPLRIARKRRQIS